MRRSCDFPLDPLSVGAARRFAVEALGEVSDEVLEAVQLMVSELATNSIRHARTGFELVVDRRPEAVRVEVTDLAGGVPEIQSPGPMDPTGRGLAIVEMFSDSWGVEYATPTNKTVWFSLAIAAEAARADVKARSGGLRHRRTAGEARRGSVDCIRTHGRGYVYRATSLIATLSCGPRLVIQTR